MSTLTSSRSDSTSRPRTGPRWLSAKTVAVGVAAAALGATTIAWQASAAPGDADATYVPVAPCRLFDLRPDFQVGERGTALGADEFHVLEVLGKQGQCNIPSDATAIAMNLTALGATAPTFVSVVPGVGKVEPTTSNLNPAVGAAPTPNQVDATLEDGKISLYNRAGEVFLFGDVVGYYTNSSLLDLDGRLAALEGADGLQGLTGPQGPAGPQGPKGPTGDKGATGTKGATGDEGPTGDTGATGSPGAAGQQGLPGAPGAPGPAGDKGEAGDQGETGDAGAPGADGLPGADGAPGPDGDKGETGDKGPDGLPGADGAPGPDGLPGADGAPGPDGDQGETGDKGPDGDKGATGDVGPQGPQGESGAASRLSDQEIALGQWQNDPATERLVTVGDGPVAIVGDGEKIYVANTIGDSVSIIEPDTGVEISQVPVGVEPLGMAFDGSRIWVANHKSNSVSVIDVATGTVTATVNVGAGPTGVAFDGTDVYVTNSDAGTVTVIDAATLVVSPTTIGVGTDPRGIVVADQEMYVANYASGSVSVIDTATKAVTATVTVTGSPEDLVYDGARVWVSTNRPGEQPSSLAVIDTATKAVDNTPIDLSSKIKWVGFDGRFVYASSPDANRVFYFSPGLPQQAPQLQLGANPGDVYFDGANIFIALKSTDQVTKLLPRR